MAELIITPLRNSVIEHFPEPETFVALGTYFNGYIYLREPVSIDSENVLGLLVVCVKTSALPEQNPGILTISQTVVRFGGCLFGATMPRDGQGSVGILFIPGANSVGRSIAMDINRYP